MRELYATLSALPWCALLILLAALALYVAGSGLFTAAAVALLILGWASGSHSHAPTWGEVVLFLLAGGVGLAGLAQEQIGGDVDDSVVVWVEGQ